MDVIAEIEALQTKYSIVLAGALGIYARLMAIDGMTEQEALRIIEGRLARLKMGWSDDVVRPIGMV